MSIEIATRGYFAPTEAPVIQMSGNLGIVVLANEIEVIVDQGKIDIEVEAEDITVVEPADSIDIDAGEIIVEVESC